MEYMMNPTFADSGGVESSYGEGNNFQAQTSYGRNQRDERHTPPRHAAATYMEGHQTIQDSYTRGERRGNEDPRQASFGRPDSYERPPDPSVYRGGSQPSYGRVQTEEERRPYEQQSTDYERRHGEHSHRQERHESRHADEPEGRRQQVHRHEHEEESQQGYGAQAYHRPGDENRYPGESHTHGGERVPYQGGYDEYGGNNPNRERQGGHEGGYGHPGGGYEQAHEYGGSNPSRERQGGHEGGYGPPGGGYERAHEYGGSNPNRERQGGYGGGGYGPPGDGYERAPPQSRYGGSETESYGERARAHGRNEDSDGTLGFERLTMQGRDEDHSERRRHHDR